MKDQAYNKKSNLDEANQALKSDYDAASHDKNAAVYKKALDQAAVKSSANKGGYHAKNNHASANNGYMKSHEVPVKYSYGSTVYGTGSTGSTGFGMGHDWGLASSF
jgi:hypothetical protein